MAFPSIEDVGTITDGTTAATSHALVYPPTVSAGALLFIYGRVAAAGAVAVTGGGWTIVQDSSDASDDVAFYGWRDTLADGTEGGTSITVTHGLGKMAARIASIIDAADPATRTPEASTVATGTSTTPDPSSLTPTGGAKDYLWLWLGGWEGEQTNPPTGNPTNYTSVAGHAVGTGTAGAVTANCRTTIATRQLNAASEDPGSWTISVSDDWAAWTIAIHPAGTAAFELALDPGSYTITGAAAGTLAARVLNAVAGSYAITGAQAALSKGFTINAEPGSYLITGSPAGTLATRQINLAPGTYAVTGSPAGLLASRVLNAEPGSYTITGFQADLVYTPLAGAFEINLEPGSYAITGTDAGVVAGRVLNAEPGAYTLTGFATGLLAARVIGALAGSYELTGFAVGLDHTGGEPVVIHFGFPSPDGGLGLGTPQGGLETGTPTGSKFGSGTPSKVRT